MTKILRCRSSCVASVALVSFGSYRCVGGLARAYTTPLGWRPTQSCDASSRRSQGTPVAYDMPDEALAIQNLEWDSLVWCWPIMQSCGLVGSVFAGLRSLVAQIMADLGESNYYISGFARLDDGIFADVCSSIGLLPSLRGPSGDHPTRRSIGQTHRGN